MWVRRLGRSGPDIGVTALYMPLPDADRLEDRVLPHQGTVRKAGSGNLWACGRGKAVSGNLAELVGIDVPTGLLIGGKWTGGRDGGTIPVIDPATEDAVAEVADGTEQDALDAVGAAHDALAGWAATPARQRAECLRRTFELMTRDADALARLMVAENGKALRDAKAEATYAAEFFRWYAEEAVRMEGVLMQAPSGANKILVMRQPVGVAWANDTQIGLVSYVYTGDLSRGLRVSEALETGMVGLNRGIVSDPAAPFGGVKQSGIGREGAQEGLLEFTETKYIATNW